MARARPPRPPQPPKPIPPTPPEPPKPKKFSANVYCPSAIKPDVGEAALKLQQLLNKDVWILAEGPNYVLLPWMYYGFRNKKSEIVGRDVALILDSFGGVSLAAFRIARLFQRNAKSFTVVVPRIAKSAATLLALGADEIILGDDAELGPLDVQVQDFDVEEARVSALDMVQAIEQLEESAIDVAMRMLKSLKEKTKKRVNLLLEPSLQFAAEVTKPLFEKIDAVSYSRHSRMLKEAEDYAVRLLVAKKYRRVEAEAIARDLVKQYSTHEFVIDIEECSRIGIVRDEDGKETRRIGLHAKLPKNAQIGAEIEKLYRDIGDVTALGKLVEG
ncbi:MAG TPA: hypothetical protein VHR66_03610 [Gemmataceae bacterium]|jgi:hypothetical protein|nr:hypothetical protein [Gemmataceae bacterium]